MCASICVTVAVPSPADDLTAQKFNNPELDKFTEQYFDRLWTAYALDDTLVGRTQNVIEQAVNMVNAACLKKYPQVDICHVEKNAVYLSQTPFSHMSFDGEKPVWEISADVLIHRDPVREMALKLAEVTVFYRQYTGLEEFRRAFRGYYLNKVQFPDAAKLFAKNLLDVVPQEEMPFDQLYRSYTTRLKNKLLNQPSKESSLDDMTNWTWKIRPHFFKKYADGKAVYVISACGVDGLERIFPNLMPCQTIKIKDLIDQPTLEKIHKNLQKIKTQMNRDANASSVVEGTTSVVAMVAIETGLTAYLGPLSPIASFLLKPIWVLGSLFTVKQLFPEKPLQLFLDNYRGLPEKKKVTLALLKELEQAQEDIALNRFDANRFQREMEDILLTYSAALPK